MCSSRPLAPRVAHRAAVAGALALAALACLVAAPPSAGAQAALAFDGTNDYVTFGAAPSLGSTAFTLELWFKRTGAGVTASTGTGGVTAIPLLTKGRGEADGDTRDMNWFLGIRGSDNVLTADYEEGAGQASVGLNHPVAGVTPIRTDVWYHAAATFDGTTWRLYLNGVLEQTLVVGAGRLPQGASIQHAALGSAVNSLAAPAGFFAGVLDEPRVWDHARTGQEIADSYALEIAAATGLRGRWALDDGVGSAAVNSAAPAANGTLTNGPLWTTGSPFALANGLSFGGTNGHATFGVAPELGLSQFTIETWFRRDGAGTTANTGTGGALAVPLVTRGVGEAEASTVDMNWFLGIRGSDGVLFADFEEGAEGASPGLNHPVAGVTPITVGPWHHAAATYDGTTWRLYLDGALENSLAVGRPPQSASIQHAGLATALNSTGVASGFFHGALDEVRIWDHARTLEEILSAMNTPLAAPTAGLVARYGLDEGAGGAIANSAGVAPAGTLTGGWSWANGAPFNLAPPSPPADPTDLVATALTHSGIRLAWLDAAGNETAYEIERSLSGAGGPFALRATLPANATGYDDAGLPPAGEACYRVRATNASGSSGWTAVACATTPAASNTALDFGGTDGYVTFGAAPGLGAEEFTVEAWFRRDGTGIATSTGAGGVSAIPLVTKGIAEQDGSVVDMNWFLGIRAADGVLVADFEEGAAGTTPGLNHPVAGVTSIANGTWHHAAVTYDGTWRVYLDGLLEATLAVGQPPQAASTQHGALGSGVKSDGGPLGFFDGALDEVRVWNYARTEAEIQSTANAQLGAAQAGLLARWALDEGSGTAVAASAGTAIDGVVVGTDVSWTAGAPFDLSFNHPPSPATLVAPVDAAVGVGRPPALEVSVSDPDGDPVTVRWYGRPVVTSAAPDFTLVHLPDTQYYTSQLNGGSNAMFRAQAQWIVDQRAARNIAYVLHVGDLSENGDNGGNPIQWIRADSVFALLEDPATTTLADGIPYGIVVGNHDQSPIGDADGTTTFYNQYFGASRFAGRSYDGGSYGASRDNWYELFSAGGIDFLVVSLEYDTSPDPAVLAWADGLLAAHPDRKAIVGLHNLVNTGNPGSFSTQGMAVYEALKARPNLLLMLGGHVAGEGRRSDTWNGNTVHSLLADYQGRTNGGSGWLRYLEFSPAQNQVRVRTYSPWLDQYEADADSSSQFTLSVPLAVSAPFSLIATQEGVPSGSTVIAPWGGLDPETAYEWSVTVEDGAATTSGPTWRFTTAADAVSAGDPDVREFSLAPITPNPMRTPSAQIAFELPRPAPVRLSLIDVRGRVVATLVDDERPAGRHVIAWDGRIAGSRAAAGLYFVRYQAEGRSLTRRLVLVH